MTRDQRIYRFAYLFASCLIGILFLTGYHKALYPADFALSVFRYHLLPDGLVNMAAVYFTWLEAVCAICLLAIPRFRVAALWISLVLLCLFTGAITINLFRDSSFSCGCFSASPLAKPMSWLSVARNGGLITLAGLGLISFRKSR
jgi:putative oxidoreductase